LHERQQQRDSEENGTGNLAALILRSALGTLMTGHGAQKVFDLFGGPGMEGTTGSRERLGLEPGKPWSVMAGASEFGGGVLALLGFLNPLGPVGVIGSMAMATTKAHWGKPIWVAEGDAELPVSNIAAATALIVGGFGRYSLDRPFGLRLPGQLVPLGLVAVIITVLHAGIDTPKAPAQDEAREGTPGTAGNPEADA
jgi:putative oxidoreductase